VTRKFSIWTKKLGHRQTGSRIVGGVGELMLFAMLALMAFVFLAALLTFQIEGWASERTVYSWPGFALRLMPAMALLLVSVTRVASIVFTYGTSAERRSALFKRAAQLKVMGDTITPPSEFPNVPRETNITNSPGTKLKYRLPVIQLSTWRFLAMSVACFLLVGIAVVLFVTAWTNQHLSSFDWATLVMCIVFVVAACLSIYAFLWELMIYGGLGPTCLEISEHPLFPGKKYGIFLNQTGRMQLKLLELHLVCNEEVTYQQGTDIRTESKTVQRIRILRKTGIRVNPDHPYETAGEFALPPDAMHSFESSHNMISWMILVHGEVEGWPNFERKFPVIVYPNV